MQGSRRLLVSVARRGGVTQAQEGALGPAHRAHILRHVIPGKVPSSVENLTPVAQNLAQAQEFMHAFTLKTPQRLAREVAKPK